MTTTCEIHDPGVCTATATAESLTALGFPVRVTETVVGSTVVARDGLPFEKARHAAWAAGVLVLCTRGVRPVVEPPRAGRIAAELLALRAAGLPMRFPSDA